MSTRLTADAVVIGGGFYGACLALLLRRLYPRVLLAEKEDDLLQRASYINQARVHAGFHYPRNLVTAYRSLVNFPRFVADFRHAIMRDFTKVYAVARLNSKVNAHRFHEMFRRMKAPIKPAPAHLASLFNPELVERAFLVREYAFDASVLKGILRRRLEAEGVELLMRTRIHAVRSGAGDGLVLDGARGNERYEIHAKHVFNCTYSLINVLLHASGLPLLPLKHEITEMALVRPPEPLRNLGVTVMDGPFFSTMPFPALGLHSLSHVRYTPHKGWIDEVPPVDGHELLRAAPPASKALHMINDAARYLPVLGGVRQEGSLFEVKTVLLASEDSDSRPILFRRDYGGLKGFHVAMGGKIDNIYDLLETIADLNDDFGDRKRLHDIVAGLLGGGSGA
ncbi:FAD-binding oxidoreductase [Desulfovibrio oxamicus]|uniref:FAD-binding oxidoreductase n=1 Tax=Nitratidesulfovibrio oxamicus TaxID=32016 RepID=A0ABS0J2K8_9BACT|nr:FAD-dependent oxidoreductase [Nitratidesulfovibrio oxamicus]MBG3876440.1 FAD-binding oxidoreductase [Nitratidesulfovibrio oxamicus]